jgi:glycosyltransferase involved in cell wall biosynthesis
LDEGIAASFAERALAGNNVPKVVITMPACRAETTLERTVADITAGITDRLILVDDASPDNSVELARALGIDVHVYAEKLDYGGNQKDQSHRGAAKRGRHHRSTSPHYQ